MAKICLFLITISMAALIFNTPTAMSDPTVPALFVLGDSTVDAGTNNNIPDSPNRADFPHYGIDFTHSRPTGRFSNSFTTADFIAKHLGFKRSPQPYLYLATLRKNAFQRPMFRGVNFASAGSGILYSTGTLVVPFTDQIQQFAAVQGNLTARLGAQRADELLSRSVVLISTGSNDLLAYLASNATATPRQFIGVLLTTYQSHLTALYGLGVRKFGILAVPPLGCIPSSRLLNATGGCVDAMNTLADDFHSALVTILPTMVSSLPGMKYSVGNSYEMIMNAIRNPQLFNCTDVTSACCGTGRLNAETRGCNATANRCPNRNEYLFWDWFGHSTQTVSKNQAEILFGGGESSYVTPINFTQLAQD